MATLRSGSKFHLDRFRINPRMGFTINLSGKLVRFLLVGLALAVPLFVIYPIGVYAASHSKALVSLFYVTDRATVSGPAPNSIIFTNDPSSPEALTFGVSARFHCDGVEVTSFATSAPGFRFRRDRAASRYKISCRMIFVSRSGPRRNPLIGAMPSSLSMDSTPLSIRQSTRLQNSPTASNSRVPAFYTAGRREMRSTEPPRR
jgi:hypothetical protein